MKWVNDQHEERDRKRNWECTSSRCGHFHDAVDGSMIMLMMIIVLLGRAWMTYRTSFLPLLLRTYVMFRVFIIVVLYCWLCIAWVNLNCGSLIMESLMVVDYMVTMDVWSIVNNWKLLVKHLFVFLLTYCILYPTRHFKSMRNILSICMPIILITNLFAEELRQFPLNLLGNAN